MACIRSLRQLRPADLDCTAYQHTCIGAMEVSAARNAAVMLPSCRVVPFQPNPRATLAINRTNVPDRRTLAADL